MDGDSNPQTIKKILNTLNKIQSTPDHGGNNLYKSIEALLKIYRAWNKRTANEGWLQSAELFESNEIAEYEPILTNIFKHYSDVISQIYSKSPSNQSGGSDTTSEQQGPDQVLRMVLNKMSQANELSRRYAVQYGLLKYLNNSDQNAASNIRTTIPTPFGPLPIILPPRVLIVAVYIGIEIMRVIVSAPMNPLRSDFLRQVLSLTMTILDLLLGRWKQAILSFAGTIGPTAMFTGQALKVYLEIFKLMGPSMSEQMIWTHWNAFKSTIIGFLLSLFQLFAPGPVRASVDSSLKSLFQNRLVEINNILESRGLQPLNDKYELSFTDINHLQTLFQEPTIVCSAEMEELYKSMESSNIFSVILQLIGFPTDDEYRKTICLEKKGKPISKLLAQEAITSASDPVLKQPDSQQNSQSPLQSIHEQISNKVAEIPRNTRSALKYLGPALK
jgi:hypothetical protein